MKVLVAVSEGYLRALLVRILAEAGIEATSVEVGTDALRQDLTSLDLVILKRRLNDVAGVDLARALRDRNSGLRFLLITGSGRSELPVPGSTVLAMPFRPDELVAKVRELIEENASDHRSID